MLFEIKEKAKECVIAKFKEECVILNLIFLFNMCKKNL